MTHRCWLALTLVAACSSRGFSLPTDLGAPEDAAPDAGFVTVDRPAGDVGVDVVATPLDGGVDVVATPLDGGVDVVAVPIDVGVDAPSPPPDRGVDVPPAPDVPTDRGVAPVDVGSVSRAAYLDPCATNADCASDDCLATAAGARWCTRRCATSADCGHGNLCGAGRCVPDDTGATCDPRATGACARHCLANSTGGAAHCTRECSVGADCPAGYACENTTIGARLCVYVEHGCTVAGDCASGLCVTTGAGYNICSSPCTADADCPRRMSIANASGSPVALAPYRCQAVGGQMVCVPPLSNLPMGAGDVMGNHALGESCGASGGAIVCYSGVCDSGENVCVQGCTPASGCPVGSSCLPWRPDGESGPLYLVCRPTMRGRGAVGATCARASDCATGACQPSTAGAAYCTRYCVDGICPTGLRCAPLAPALDGTALATCTR